MQNLTTTIFNADKFDRFCQENPDLQVERTAEGELIVSHYPLAVPKFRSSHQYILPITDRP